ncbi:hypothetical protein K435DRAFT_821338 [Dendrothele bispora CBS 962.96]|uniref:Integrase core domain-containing protein n=1 Tax=Dendrothele bispora (strain CBS 962.96) TaxID=1314807 RepID=A0A4S8LL19_DENBC|nr:hypothetical protein K435DRAFT_821338 [Dendrothele bispora CBS 962.96]
MLENRGLDRGSYIWGRSVHNTRIERLWFDVTQGFGKKWYHFFLDLEYNHGLDSSNDTQIWLLHHLFLPCINQDAQEWAETWNNHQITIKGEQERSPHDMFFFSQLQDGVRGIYRRPEPIDYGIDWQVIGDSDLMAHLLHSNPDEWRHNAAGAFDSAPESYSRVDVLPLNCPLTTEQVQILDTGLASRVDINSRNMLLRRTVWDEALIILNSFFAIPT